MNNPSPSAIAAAAVEPNPRAAATIVVAATVPTVKHSPVRAFFTRSPRVKIAPELEPAPVSVTV